MSGLFDGVMDAIVEKRNQLDAWANDDKSYLDQPAYGPGLMDIQYGTEPGASYYMNHGEANGADFDISDVDKWRRADRAKAKYMHMNMVKEKYGDKPYSRQQNVDVWQEVVNRLMNPDSGYVVPKETVGRWPLGSKHNPMPDWMKAHLNPKRDK